MLDLTYPPRSQHVMGSIGPIKLQREPLKNSGAIDHLKYVDVTPIIGREYRRQTQGHLVRS